MNRTLILQAGNYMVSEKIACSFSRYRSLYFSFEKLCTLRPEDYRMVGVPVGTVEYTREYCRVMGISLPSALGYPDFLKPFLFRSIKQSTFSEAGIEDFVKPYSNVKLFTGSIKRNLVDFVKEDELVWVSERVPFESEFRFYIQDFVTGPKILGWSRYDDLEVRNPEPDMQLVENISQLYHKDLGPSAYSIDIGWRPDLQRYSLVEINDGWSLGLYKNSDPQSAPPCSYSYADMLVSRWNQILFCNLFN